MGTWLENDLKSYFHINEWRIINLKGYYLLPHRRMYVSFMYYIVLYVYSIFRTDKTYLYARTRVNSFHETSTTCFGNNPKHLYKSWRLPWKLQRDWGPGPEAGGPQLAEGPRSSSHQSVLDHTVSRHRAPRAPPPPQLHNTQFLVQQQLNNCGHIHREQYKSTVPLVLKTVCSKMLKYIFYVNLALNKPNYLLICNTLQKSPRPANKKWHIDVCMYMK